MCDKCSSCEALMKRVANHMLRRAESMMSSSRDNEDLHTAAELVAAASHLLVPAVRNFKCEDSEG